MADLDPSMPQTFTFIVNPVSDVPGLTAIANKTVAEGSLLTLVTAASDADLPPQPLAFGLETGAPDIDSTRKPTAATIAERPDFMA